MSTLKELMNSFPYTGTLELITVRPERRGEVLELTETEAIEAVGLLGDHRSKRKPNPKNKRQVTLIQAEHLKVVAALLDQDKVIDPKRTRRNLVVSGINLYAFERPSVFYRRGTF